MIMTWKQTDLEKVHRFFYPQTPVIITAEHEGHVGAMPAIWCMPLSFKPALVGVALAPEHETHKIIKASQAFALNWLDFSLADKVGELGETSAKMVANKLSAVGLTAIKGDRTSQPLIQDAFAAMECRVTETHRTGTHELMVGEVVKALAMDFDDYWDFSQYNPLLYAGTINGKSKSWVFKSTRGETTIVPLKHQT